MTTYFKPANWQEKPFIPVVHDLIKDMSREIANQKNHTLTDEQRYQLFNCQGLCDEWLKQPLNPRQQAWVEDMQQQLTEIVEKYDSHHDHICGYKW